MITDTFHSQIVKSGSQTWQVGKRMCYPAFEVKSGRACHVLYCALSAAAELGTLLGVLDFNVEFDELDLVTAREAKSAALVLLVVVVVSLATLLGLVVVLIVTLATLVGTVVVTLTTLLPIVTSPLGLGLTTLTSVDSNPDVVLELGVTGDLLNRNVALVLLAVLVEVEVLLVLDALFLVVVEAEECNLVGVFVPVLVDDVEALLFAVSATEADLGSDPVVVTLRALQILAGVS
ncbi:hypothetical protein HG530_004376 [Fusarium avenaceum]|nr:hypothetical protein HG530_004376 [Fusarium avenaceum]